MSLQCQGLTPRRFLDNWRFFFVASNPKCQKSRPDTWSVFKMRPPLFFLKALKGQKISIKFNYNNYLAWSDPAAPNVNDAAQSGCGQSRNADGRKGTLERPPPQLEPEADKA